MNKVSNALESKVPEVTLWFWILKVAATTLGETGGDALSMSMGLGYLVSTIIFGALFGVLVYWQIYARKFYPPLYWGTIVASTTVGTTLADLADRSFGIGYTGGSAILLLLLLGSLAAWRSTLGSVAVTSITSKQAEFWYWTTLMCSQTLGTALGDWSADTAGIGYLGSASLFTLLIIIVLISYYATNISSTILFWIAFVLTRPLGAVVGDFLDKPMNEGGLALSRYSASFALFAFIAIGILIFPHQPAKERH
ncbi:MAG: hypothetical protein K1X79_01400 [Oligoflexia bacterium]|nr:hypothetical protein [Oligoflexia bacterium]